MKTPAYTVIRLNSETESECVRGLTHDEALNLVAEWTATKWFHHEGEVDSETYSEGPDEVFVIQEPMLVFDETQLTARRYAVERKNRQEVFEQQRAWKQGSSFEIALKKYEE